MKVIGIHTVETIEHNGEVYERSGGCGWKQHVGESMEQVYAQREEDLEAIYLTLKNTDKPVETT